MAVSERFQPRPSGTWGMRNASWKQVAEALEMLGGQFARTSKNGHVIYNLDGNSLTLTGASKMGQLIGRSTLKNFVKLVEDAGVPQLHFITALSLAGAGWSQKPDVVRVMEVIVRKHKGLMKTSEGRRTLHHYLMEDMDGEKKVTKEVAQVLREEDQAPTNHKYTHRLTDAVRLANTPDNLVNRYRARLSWHLQQATGPAKEWLAGDLVRRLPDPNGVRAEVWLFNEEGALAAAHYVEEAMREQGVLPSAPEPSPEPEPEPVGEPVEEEPVEQVAPVEKAPEVIEQKQELGVAEAVLALCIYHQVMPVMDGVALDVDATLRKLAVHVAKLAGGRK